MAGLIRRKTLPKLIKTSVIAARWGKSTERVRQILKAHGVQKVQFAEAKNAPFSWILADVERVEEKIFGGVL